MAAPAATGHRVPCGKPCGGRMFFDPLDREWVCVNCGYRPPQAQPVPANAGARGAGVPTFAGRKRQENAIIGRA